MNELVSDRCDPLLLIEALRHSGKALESALDAELLALGLSAAKWAALRVLAENGDQLSLGQLADKLACVRSNATQLVDRMETDRLVRRVSDPNDRRSVSAEITEQGRARYNEGLSIIRSFERDLLGDFTHEEHLVLTKLLARLHDFQYAHART